MRRDELNEATEAARQRTRSADEEDSPEPLPRPWPKHLTKPSSNGWCIWRTFGLRGAGFPAALALELSDPHTAEVADRLNGEEAAATEAWAQAALLVQRQIDTLLQRHGPSNLVERPSCGWPADLSPLRRAANLIARRKLDDPLAEVLGAERYSRLAALHAGALSLQVQFCSRYAQVAARLSDAIGEVAGNKRFREAVVWQNHDALSAVLESLVSGSPMPGAKRRQREDLVANYVQRYSLKNDTIGFFGPVAWGTVTNTNVQFIAKPASQLLAARNIYFEDWPIASLSHVLAADPRYTPWLKPKLLPFLRVDGKRLIFPGGTATQIGVDEAHLVKACDGRRNARSIARRLLANPFCGFIGEDDVFNLLRKFEAQQRIELTFPIPSSDARPERALREHLRGISDGELRDEALTALGRLEQARGRLASAAGSAEDLRSAMLRLDEIFEELTNHPSRRRHGEAYGGRALVYEDCRRDVRVELGEEALLQLQESLDLVLISARWFTESIGMRYRVELHKIFQRLVNKSGAQCLDLPTFWMHAQAMFFGDQVPSEEVVAELTRRWESILPPLEGRHRVDIPAQSIQDAVVATFGSRQPGWREARYQSPDLMFCAPDADSIMTGQYLAVLGEVHVGGNTLLTNGFVWQHTDPDALLRARCADLGSGNITPKLSGDGSRRPIRTQAVDDPCYGFEVLFSRGAVPCNPDDAVNISELDIVEFGGTLQIQHRTRRWQRDILDLFGEFIYLAVGSEFRVLAKRRQTPRVTVGNLVIHRETWRVPCSEFDFVHLGHDASCFRDARRFMQRHGMPSKVFVKVPWENKPFLVDFDSPLYVRGFAKHIRAGFRAGTDSATQVAISEMLPSFGDHWLSDGQGQRYTSELRMVAIHRDDVAAVNQRAI